MRSPINAMSLLAYCLPSQSPMDIRVRPTKRRNTRKDRPLIEGDLEAADAVTVEHVKVSTRRGTVVKPVLVPIDAVRAEANGDRLLPAPQDGPTADYQNVDIEMDGQTQIPRRNMVRTGTRQQQTILTRNSNNITSGNLQGRLTASWQHNWNARL
jgi:hypothetical protein